MKSYIIAGLDNTDKELLHSQGVVFYPWDKDIIIDQPQLDLVLKLLNAKATEAPTEYENLYLLKLEFQATGSSTKGNQRTVERQRAQSRANYIQVCSARLNALLAETQATVSKRKTNLLAAQDKLVTLARHFFLTNKLVSQDKLKQLFEEQYQRLLEVPKVRAIRVTNKAILIYTDTLYVENPRTGRRHELGEYLIVIHPDGSHGGVQWFNTTRRVRTLFVDMNAPRVYADGTACVDDIRETLLELIAQFEFATVAELAIQFVETLADDELSKYVERWPCVQTK